MKKVIRLTESDLTRIVRRVLSEQSGDNFSSWLKGHENIKNSKCPYIINCLQKNGYQDYNSAPNQFKNLVQKTFCFASDYSLKDAVGKYLNDPVFDPKTKKLFACLVNTEKEGPISYRI